MSEAIKIASLAQLKQALAQKQENTVYELTTNIDFGGETVDKTLSLGAGSVLDGNGYALLHFTAGENGIFDLPLTGAVTFRNLTFGAEDAPIGLTNCLVNREPRKETNDSRDPEYLPYETDPEETVWENVTVYADIESDTESNIGVFYAKTCGKHSFTNCHVTVNACSPSCIGGFIGYFYGSSLVMDHCTVNGELKSMNAGKYAPVGGFLGVLGEKGKDTMPVALTMTGCVNNARVEATRNPVAGQKSFAGGFIGVLWDSRDSFSIRATLLDCINRGEIVSNMSAGGILGVADTLSPYLTLKGCVNHGRIVGVGDGPVYAGGLIGRWNSSGLLSVSHSVNNGTVCGCSMLGGIVASSDRGYLNLYFCHNAGNLIATKGSHVGGITGSIGEKIKCVGCVNTGEISSADGEKVGNIGQITSKSVNQGIFRNCYAFGRMTCEVVNCGPVLAVPPSDLTCEGNRFIPSEFYNKYIGVDETAPADEETAKALLSNWQKEFDQKRSPDTAFDPIAMWKSVFGEEIPPYRNATFCPDVYTDNVSFTQQTRNLNGYKMIHGEGASKADFDAYIRELENNGCKVTSAGEHHTAISGYWVEKGSVRMYAYISEKSGVVRFILDVDEWQTSIENFSYHYDKKPEDTTTFYMYGLRMNPYGININETYALLDEKKYPELAAKYNPLIQAKIDANGGDPKNFADKNCGMMMVVKLADNSIIWIDGGERAQMSVEAAIRLDEFLHEITDTPMDQVVTIRTWFLTHYHGDHFAGFMRFMVNFSNRYKVERVMYNLRESGLPSWLVSYMKKIQGFYPDVIFHRLHTGETIHLGDVDLDVMYTGEDLVHPTLGTFDTQDSNDTTTALRFRFDGMSVMALGDLAHFGGETLIKMYNDDDLKADVMQVPHHGWNYLGKVFRAINPQISLYAQSEHGARMGIRGGASRVFESVVENTRGGVDSIYYAGKSTTGLGVVNGKPEVVFWEETCGKAWDGSDGGMDTPRWDDLTPFPQEVLDRY